MPYIMENISLYENQSIKQTNMVVKHNIIYSRDTPVNQFKYTRLNLDKYILIAGETVVGDILQWQKDGMRYVEELVLSGATTIVFPIDIQYEYQLNHQFEAARASLSVFPLDYCLVLRMPLLLVKPSIIRYCKKHLVPAIITRIQNIDEMNEIPWSWIKEASFPYNLAFFPQFNNRQSVSLLKWEQILTDQLLPHYASTITEHMPLSKDVLKLIGIYPFKGFMRCRGEVSYNIIHQKYENCLNNDEKSYYDKIECTILKNKVIRAGKQWFLTQSLGEELLIKVPGFFHS